MKPFLPPVVAVVAAGIVFLLSTGCSRLSPEARKIAGSYYIPEVSTEVPLMDLYSDGTCVMRAVKPGVLTYSVPGVWDVKRDSLLCELRTDRLKFEGDSTMIGNVASRIAHHINAFNGTTITIEKEGIEYIYYRREK